MHGAEGRDGGGGRVDGRGAVGGVEGLDGGGVPSRLGGVVAQGGGEGLERRGEGGGRGGGRGAGQIRIETPDVGGSAGLASAFLKTSSQVRPSSSRSAAIFSQASASFFTFA